MAQDAWDVVIVGAGIAGLSACRTLQRLGVDRVVVVESRARVGGRIHTVDVGGMPLDAGAGWVHGVEGNPLSPLAQSARADLLPTSRGNVWIEPHVSQDVALYCGGRPVPEECQRAACSRFAAMRASVREEALACPDAAAACRPAFARAAQVQQPPLGPMGRAVLRWCEDRTCLWMGQDLEGIRLSEFEDEGLWGDYPGPHAVVAQGAATLAAAAADGLPIRLSTHMDRVSCRGERGVVLTLSSGERLTAAACVLTVPLPVLRRGRPALSPPLAPPAAAALAGAAAARYEKVVLRFERPWWPLDKCWIGALEGSGGDGGAHFPLFLSYWPIKRAPVIVAFATGERAEALARLGSDRARVDAAVRALSAALGRPMSALPPLVSSLVTHWWDDPLACGSYAGFPPGVGEAEVAALAAVHHGRLVLAGDGLHSTHEGSLHGAWLSGQEQASRLVEAVPALRAGRSRL